MRVVVLRALKGITEREAKGKPRDRDDGYERRLLRLLGCIEACICPQAAGRAALARAKELLVKGAERERLRADREAANERARGWARRVAEWVEAQPDVAQLRVASELADAAFNEAAQRRAIMEADVQTLASNGDWMAAHSLKAKLPSLKAKITRAGKAAQEAHFKLGDAISAARRNCPFRA